jgi:hypothetical protein
LRLRNDSIHKGVALFVSEQPKPSAADFTRGLWPGCCDFAQQGRKHAPGHIMQRQKAGPYLYAL